MAACCSEYCRKIGEEVKSLAFWRDILAEFVGTFFLMSVQSALPLAWGQPHQADVRTGIGMGFVVMIMAGSLGDFSGGHLNPAVTLGFAVIAQVTIIRAVLYIVAQCAGAVAGAALIKLVTPAKYEETLARTGLGDGVEWWQGLIIEAWITMMLVLTVLGTTNARRRSGGLNMPTMLIGFAVACGIMCAFHSTGGSMNPARSLGPAVVTTTWTNLWIYWAGPCAGAVLAAFLFKMMDLPGRPDKFD